MKMPEQKPGRSEQVVVTPVDLLNAIRETFRVDEWDWDLAATGENRVGTRPHFGPGSAYGEDALQHDWGAIAGNLWLNPPYANIAPWVAKCASTRRAEGRIFVLLPAAVGSNWFQTFVHEQAHVYFLNPRVTFVGHKQPYPKDLILAVYGPTTVGYTAWRWKP